MSESARLIKNTGLIAIGNFGAKMISFLLLPLYTSLLSTSEYGTYDFIVAVSAFLLPIVTMSMHEAMFRFIIDAEHNDKEFKKIITNSLCAVMLGIGVMGTTMLVVEYIMRTGLMLYIFVYVVANSIYIFANNMLRGMGRMKTFALVSSSKNIMQLILNVIVVAVFRWGMEGLLLALCASEMIAFIAVAYIARLWRQIDFKSISFLYIRKLLKYSLPLIPNSLSTQIINISGRLVISGFMGNAANGIYAVSYKFPTMVDTMYHFFYTAWSESASRVFSRGEEEAKKYYRTLHDTLDNFVFSAILVLVASMPIMFRILVKGDYTEGFIYVPMLLFAMYFSSMAKFFSGIYTALKKTRIMASSTIIAAVINLVVNIALIKFWGLYAAAFSTLLADVLLMFMRRRFLKDFIVFELNLPKTIARFIVVGIVICVYDYNNPVKIIVGILVATIYAIIENKMILIQIYNKSIKLLKKR